VSEELVKLISADDNQVHPIDIHCTAAMLNGVPTTDYGHLATIMTEGFLEDPNGFGADSGEAVLAFSVRCRTSIIEGCATMHQYPESGDSWILVSEKGWLPSDYPTRH
jgi:hypothetical protein